MAQFRGFTIPTMQAAVNVAWETIKAKMPENSPCMEFLRTSSFSGPQAGSSDPNRQRFDGAEMTTMNEENGYEDPNNHAMAEESFSYQRSE